MDLPLPEAARTYASYMAGTFALMMIVILARNVFPALDCGSLPVYVLSAAVPLNAILNAVLMYGWFGLPEMGLAGAGASSMAIAFFMAILFAAYVTIAPRMKGLGVTRLIAGISWYPAFVSPGEMFFVGAASLCETGVFLISTMMIGFFEISAISSHIAVFRMVAVTYVLTTGIGQAITIHAARRATRSAALSSLELSALLVAIIIGPAVMALVNIVPASIFASLELDGSKIAQIAPHAAISVCAMVPTLMIRGFLRAVSDSIAPAIIGVFGYWFVGFPSMLYLAGHAGHGAAGVWYGLAIGTVATAAMFMAYFIWKRVLADRFRPATEGLVALASPYAK
jgi:MATE family multidrug resistance protein